MRRLGDPFRELWGRYRRESRGCGGAQPPRDPGVEPSFPDQLDAFGEPERSPSTHVVSIVYWALCMADQVERAADDDNARWFPSDDPPRRAFAHNVIVDYALWRLGTKREYSRIAHALLSETFRRDLHEAVLQGLSIPLIPDGRSRHPSCRPMSLSRAAGTAHGASIAPTPAPGSSIMVRSGAIN